MRIDLHTHSCVSDGTDQPDALVRHAKEAGLDIVALTDHDTFDGWSRARDAGEKVGVEVIGGVEISTKHRGTSVHVLAYFVDPLHSLLDAELARIRLSRQQQLSHIAAALTAHGLELDVADITRRAPHASTVGRAHVADAMVDKGYVRDRREAFALWLNEGKPGYHAKYSPSTHDAIALVKAAGGVSVLAHPWGRASRKVLDPQTIRDFHEGGLDGIEVDHQDHDSETREELKEVATELGLVVTGSSDYHGSGKVDHNLGANLTDPQEWRRLCSRAEDHTRGRA